jgi:hypothetical protein
MAVGRAQRRIERQPRFAEEFGPKSKVALDLIEIMELAWHDCYHEITPPDEVIEDLLICAHGSIEGLVTFVRLALADWRDLRVAADCIRAERP